MKTLIACITFIVLSSTLSAQTTSTRILEDGIRIDTGYVLFLEYDTTSKAINYAISKSRRSLYFDPLSDSSIFIADKIVPIYLLPMNPLNFSEEFKSEIKVDPLTTAFESQVDGFIEILSKVEIAQFLGDEVAEKDSLKLNNDFSSIKNNIAEIAKLLKDEHKTEIIKTFRKLKKISFRTESSTIKDLNSVLLDIKKVDSIYAATDSLISETRRSVGQLSWEFAANSEVDFIFNYVIEQMLSDLYIILKTQRKRLEDLKMAYKVCSDYKEKACEEKENSGFDWCIRIPHVTVKGGKITESTIDIFSASVILSDKEEIISVDRTKLASKTLIFRKYNAFVPEFSGGIAYTSFSYNTYSTTSDSTGKMFVASPKRNYMDNFNITAMMNFNFYRPNADAYIHPLLQFGAGINNGMPTLLTGTGFRINTGTGKRLAITFGAAWTWMRELDTLSVGDEVAGQSDIENDLIYKFSWPPRGYLGIQINL